MGAIEHRTIGAALAFGHPFTGRRYHMIYNEAISMLQLPHHLVCINQFRVAGWTVNECPRMYCANPNKESHTIVCEYAYG